jgi:hypothetical protein
MAQVSLFARGASQNLRELPCFTALSAAVTKVGLPSIGSVRFASQYLKATRQQQL